jgi:hypothetical protein
VSTIETLLDVGRLTWRRVESHLHVASRDGEFAGFVEENADGTFVAFDQLSTPVGRYTTLARAQHALTTTAPVRDRRRRRALRISRGAATVAGAVAGVALMTAGVLAPYL